MEDLLDVLSKDLLQESSDCTSSLYASPQERTEPSRSQPYCSKPLPQLPLPLEIHDSLYPFQRDGIQWLFQRHLRARAALLADEMGLGKTVQVCAFLCAMFKEQLIHTALIVAPVSLLTLWENELERWGGLGSSGSTPVTVVHTGGKAKREAKWRRLRMGAVTGVYITSYGVIRQDIKAIALSASGAPLLDYIILDEVHCIRDRSSSVFSAVMELSARHRIALTGTPMMNRLDDMLSVFQFLDGGLAQSNGEDGIDSARSALKRMTKSMLKCERSDSTESDKDAFKKESQKELHSLQAVMESFTLRRMKSEVAAMLPSDNELQVNEAQGTLPVHGEGSPYQEDVDPRKEPWPVAVRAGMGRKHDTVVWIRLTDSQQAQYVLLLKRWNILRHAPPSCSTGPERNGEECDEDSLAQLLDENGDHTWVEDRRGPEPGQREGPQQSKHSPSVSLANNSFKREALTMVGLLRDTCQHPWMLLHEAAFNQALTHSLSVAPCTEIGNGYSGAKLHVALEIIKERGNEGHRSLVFSSSKRLLKILSRLLDEHSISWCQLDGETKPADRLALVRAFNGDESLPSGADACGSGGISSISVAAKSSGPTLSTTQVCLLTMQIGSLGFTFQKASCVILLSPSCNPSLDNQAVDRVHRIGQQREDVFIYRLLSCGTVEERMYEKQLLKISAIRDVMDEPAHLEPLEESCGSSPHSSFSLFGLGSFERCEGAAQNRVITRHDLTTPCRICTTSLPVYHSLLKMDGVVGVSSHLNTLKAKRGNLTRRISQKQWDLEPPHSYCSSLEDQSAPPGNGVESSLVRGSSSVLLEDIILATNEGGEDKFSCAFDICANISFPPPPSLNAEHRCGPVKEETSLPGSLPSRIIGKRARGAEAGTSTLEKSCGPTTLVPQGRISSPSYLLTTSGDKNMEPRKCEISHCVGICARKEAGEEVEEYPTIYHEIAENFNVEEAKRKSSHSFRLSS